MLEQREFMMFAAPIRECPGRLVGIEAAAGSDALDVKNTTYRGTDSIW